MDRAMPNAKPLALALAASLVIGLAAADADAQRKGAAPKEPPLTACSDFYTFTNKDWLDANPPGDGAAMVSTLGELQARARDQQRELLDTAMRAPQGNLQKLLGDFWASGLDVAAVERDGAQPIAPLLERINGIRRARDVPPAIAALHQVGIPVAFGFSADVDLADLERHIGYFAQGGMGLPDPAYYTRTDADTRALLGRYVDYVQKILVLTGTPQDKAAEQAQQVIDLETRIAQVSRPIPALRDPRQNYALVPTADLGKTYKRLQLDRFLEAQGVDDDSVSMANPALFAQLDQLVGSLKPEQWKTYLRFHVGDAMAPYLSRSFRDAAFEFRGRVLRGETAPPERADMVLDAINRAAGPMLAREYVARYLPPANSSRAETIAGEVRDALARGLDQAGWMSDAARAEAKAKVAALGIEIGAPDRDLDFTIQPMGRGSFGGNMLIASTWHHREQMRRIGRENASRRWDVLPQAPAIAYDIAHNRLIVSAAALQPPILDMTQVSPAHYGSLGTLVGHELGRAVDIKGRIVDASGAVRTWWTPQDDAAWNALGNRLSAQYNAYDYPGTTGLKVNGVRTRDENAADLAGLELAWSALGHAQQELTEDDRKAFFEAWAQMWRQQASAETAARNAEVSLHAPGMWRVNGTLANLPAFGETYKCKADAAMQREAQEQVSIWR
jgi:putative endopeptidase